GAPVTSAKRHKIYSVKLCVHSAKLCVRWLACFAAARPCALPRAVTVATIRIEGCAPGWSDAAGQGCHLEAVIVGRRLSPHFSHCCGGWRRVLSCPRDSWGFSRRRRYRVYRQGAKSLQGPTG